jgi:CRP-like cAMP-binding protein
MNDKYIEQMKVALNRLSPLSSNDWSRLEAIFQVSEYSKQSHIVQPAEDDSRLFFICSGLIRYYYLDNKGCEWNKAFLKEDTLSASFSKDFLGDLSPYGIQALESTVLLTASYLEFESLYEASPMIERLGRKFIEQILISKMQRERSFLQNDTKKRYLDFLSHSPDLAQRLSQYHLASYLGVSEVSLSRIRSQLSEKIINIC